MSRESPDEARDVAGHPRRVLVMAAALAVLLLIAASASLHGVMERAFEAVGDLLGRHPVVGTLAFTGLAAMSAMLAFFSSAVVVPVGVQHWGGLLTGILLWAGWLIGGALSYAIGRFFGARVMGLLVSPARIRYYQERVGQVASFGTLLLFQSAVPSEIPGYVLGTVRGPFLKYLAVQALAELPYAVGAVLLGGGFLRRQYSLMIALGLLGIGAVTWAAGRLHRRIGDAGLVSSGRAPAAASRYNA
ncbi:MAG TPA: VTT domain-containing protein [Vicinamibacteria bacterium]|nr:VTT domain-containing protein [Vicinamibacteria bacterium]